MLKEICLLLVRISKINIMDFEELYELNPSELMQKIQELNHKKDYEGISKEEVEELSNLKTILNDAVGDLNEAFFV